MLPTFNCLWVHQTTFSNFAYMALESILYMHTASPCFSAIFMGIVWKKTSTWHHKFLTI